MVGSVFLLEGVLEVAVWGVWCVGGDAMCGRGVVW